jgi:hypothetical protein
MQHRTVIHQATMTSPKQSHQGDAQPAIVSHWDLAVQPQITKHGYSITLVGLLQELSLGMLDL